MDHLFVLFDLSKCLFSKQMPGLSDHRIRDYLLLLRQLNYLPWQRVHLIVRLQHLKHIPKVLTLHYLVLQYLYQPQSHWEQRFRPFQQKVVEDLKRRLLWHRVGEDADEPLEGQDWGVEAKRLKFPVHELKFLLDETHEHFLVDEDTHHHREIVKGEVSLHNHSENPKSLLLCQKFPESACYKVHALAITYNCISFYIRFQYSLKWILYLLLLKKGVSRVGPLQIQ